MINSDAAVRLFYLKTAIELIALIFSIGAAATTIYCALDARATQRETVAIVVPTDPFWLKNPGRNGFKRRRRRRNATPRFTAKRVDPRSLSRGFTICAQ